MPRVRLRVGPEATPLGRLEVCSTRDPRSALVTIVVTTTVACLVLWLAAAAIARRLTRPIAELASVADRLGRGDLSARFALAPCAPTSGREARVDAEVEALGGAFNTMAERIEAQMRAQKELLAHVSHELRTPLARIRLLTELARESPSGSERLDGIDREVEEIDALVGALLADARIDFSLVQRTQLDAVEVGRRALDRAGLPSDLLRSTQESFVVDADPTLLARGLANLLDNARQHGGGVEALCVELGPAGEVRFVVDDRGPGLPDGDVSALFQPFSRAARDAEHGSLGLGLALVRRIAEAHGGAVVAERREGGGARVGLSLPCSDALVA